MFSALTVVPPLKPWTVIVGVDGLNGVVPLLPPEPPPHAANAKNRCQYKITFHDILPFVRYKPTHNSSNSFQFEFLQLYRNEVNMFRLYSGADIACFIAYNICVIIIFDMQVARRITCDFVHISIIHIITNFDI